MSYKEPLFPVSLALYLQLTVMNAGRKYLGLDDLIGKVSQHYSGG